MGSLTIFICRDCKIATKYVEMYTGPESFSWGYEEEGLLEFYRQHKKHRIEIQPDAHGQIDSDDFFKGEKNEMRNR